MTMRFTMLPLYIELVILVFDLLLKVLMDHSKADLFRLPVDLQAQLRQTCRCNIAVLLGVPELEMNGRSASLLQLPSFMKYTLKALMLFVLKQFHK